MKNLLIVSACLAVIGFTQAALAQFQSQPAGKMAPALSSQLAALEADEPVRVIIEFNTPAIVGNRAGESNIAGARWRTSQRSAVAAGREAMLQSEALADLAGGIRRTYDYAPLIAFEGKRSEVETFARSANVSRIYVDEPVPPTLAASTSIINAPPVWAAGFDGSGQAVAILDTGVDRAHSFFGGRVVAEACFSSNSPSFNATTVCPNGQQSQTGTGAGVHCSTSIRGCDHGTHVAGIAAANDPFSNADGVARGASIIAVQVFSRFDNPSVCGSSAPCVLSFTSDQIAGLDYVLSLTSSLDVAAVNMSLGGGRFFSPCSGQAQEGSMNNLKNAGVAVVVSSGNDGFVDSISSPACIPAAISVGSTTDTTDQVSSFTNSATFLDLLAPGQVITSTIPNNRLGNKSGTSMAAPHVAGAFAVLRQARPTYTVDQILTALENTGQPVFDPGNGLTKPRIDLQGAYNAVTASPSRLPADVVSAN